MSIAMHNLDVHRHTRPSSAYADAAGSACDTLDAIRDAVLKSDCREATWIAAEEMTRLALQLQDIAKRLGCVNAD